MEKNNPFSPLQARVDRFLNHDLKAQQWEAARVEWLVKRIDVLPEFRELRKEASFVDRVLFREFNDWFQTFPMQFAAEALVGDVPIDADVKYTHPHWFQAFLDLPIVRKYEKHFVTWKEGSDKRPLGVVFPRLGFQQGLIIHNGGLGFVPVRGSAHVFKTGVSDSVVCVQPFSQLIDHIQATTAWR